MDAKLSALLCISVLLNASTVYCAQDDFDPAACVDPWIYIDFDSSMQLSKFPAALKVTKQIVGLDGMVLYNFFKELYERNNPSKIEESSELKIPKIIHQIWLGGPLPEEFKKYMVTWVKRHMKGWKYKLWTDADIKYFGLYNQKYYDATDNYGIKSDILKWEIVYRYGGVYVDTDYECLKSIEPMHYLYDFYTAMQPLDTQFIQLGAALFGGVPKHPIMKHCIESIKDDWHFKGAPMKSGPVHFTKSFYAVAGRDGSLDIAFPASYFYPLGAREKDLDYDKWLEEGAYAIHHWAKSWMPPEYRYKKFRSIKNYDSAKSWNS